MKDIKRKQKERGMVKWLLLFVSIGTLGMLQGQSRDSTYPTQGMRCPDWTLHNLQQYPKSEVSLRDTDGKWRVLFFWTAGCRSAVQQLASVYEVATTLQSNREVEVLLISKERSKERQIDSIYQESYGYTVPSAFDSEMTEKFGISIFPYVVVLDPSGTIVGIGDQINLQQIQAFVSGENPPLRKAYNKAERASMGQIKDTDTWLASVGTDALAQSVLKEFQYEVVPYGLLKAQRYQERNELFVSCADVLDLYMVAYGPQEYMTVQYPENYQHWWKRPIVTEGVDTMDLGWEYSLAPTLYAYDVRIPNRNTSLEALQTYMQQDLERYFGYDVQVEQRMMPYWSLQVTEEGKAVLATQGEATFGDSDGYTFFHITNKPISELTNFLGSLEYRDPPVIDETGLMTNVDLNIDAILMDREQLNTALAAYGLSLVLQEKPMQVVVIRPGTVSGSELDMVGEQVGVK